MQAILTNRPVLSKQVVLCLKLGILGAWLCFSAPVLAQGLRNNQALNLLDNTLRTGRILGQSTSGSGGRGGGGGASGLGFVSGQSAATGFSGGGPAGMPAIPLNYQGTTQLGGASTLMLPFGRNASARVVTPPIYAGSRRMSPPMAPRYSSVSTLRILSDDMKLLRGGSFHHRVYEPIQGGAIRDELTNTSLAHPYEVRDEEIEKPRKTHAEILAQRIQARHDRYIREGWQRLAEGAYLRAINAFDNAAVLRPENLEAQVGRFLSSVGSDELQTASSILLSMLDHPDNIFSMRKSLDEAFGEDRDADKLMARIEYLAELSTESPDQPALDVYLKWLNGRDAAARDAARNLENQFRTSAFARLRSLMDEFENADEDDVPELRALMDLES
jgi:hypothetical protein